MFTTLKTISLAALLASVARASPSAIEARADSDFRVIVPGGDDLWWVASSSNNIIWTCEDSPYQSFSVYLTNTDVNVLSGPIGIIATQNNYDCSKTITQQQAAQPAGKGYKILLTDPLNMTNIYAASEEFEIKPLGSTYPDASATPGVGAGGSGTATSSGASASSTAENNSSDDKNGAASVGYSLTGVVGAVVGAVAALL
ncbi:uncharacterized protein SCHCODRAFT_02635773 [Schizophyllum commune H4-8]|uniref:uncharacterized protein n=1 Tax=Schizophyllum commune (strain H4-8 / FGSC 9210) TaxID=578458 RepID=UPI00215EE003|nr:uncharacterized protein SCHCODRAFT_02635773 [Schizophyllum commune H4-8]KAI5888122.1 hypothetical protein SCHCODRAFT_02635773 [Schizophyllum commune H4-8]